MKRKKGIVFMASLFVVLVAAVGLVSLRVKGQVKELFKLNKALQEEGYYMAEFEFHLLGFAYLLDRGEFLEALRRLDAYHHKLSNRVGLVHIPDFGSVEEEIDFYLGLQNPGTGAFMDASAPFCTYFSVTENVIEHLDALFASRGEPVRLRYPLVFLDEINTPEALVAYLDDISSVGWFGSRFPQTSFHFARDMLSNVVADNVIARNSLYAFSPEWKQAMLAWMYEFQDPGSGLWGPKDKTTHVLRKADVSNTYSIVKKFRDENGKDIHAGFPLRYAQKLFASVVEQLSTPIPDGEDLAGIHEYNLEQAKGIKLLLSRLWEDGSPADRQKAITIIKDFVILSFKNYYVKEEGAFSFYPHAEHATVDGMSNMIFWTTGAFSPEKQRIYWGDPARNIDDLGTVTLDRMSADTLQRLQAIAGINSWRIYVGPPDFTALEENVWALVYPQETKVLDICELVPNIIHWTERSPLSTGNWKSMADIANQYARFSRRKPQIYHRDFPFTEASSLLRAGDELHVMGFDLLQVPRFKVGFRFGEGGQ